MWGKEHYVTFEVSFGTSLVLSLSDAHSLISTFSFFPLSWTALFKPVLSDCYFYFTFKNWCIILENTYRAEYASNSVFSMPWSKLGNLAFPDRAFTIFVYRELSESSPSCLEIYTLTSKGTVIIWLLPAVQKCSL